MIPIPRTFVMKHVALLIVCVFVLITNATLASERIAGTAPVTIALAADGKALIPIVLDPQAEAPVEALARELADGLRRISGASFDIVRDRRPHGIVVGTDRDRPGVVPPIAADFSPRMAREDYVLRSSSFSLLVIGREAIGLQDAVWDLLFRLGFRQYFPGAKWELWPREARLSVGIDVTERPDYFHRGFMFTGLAAPSLLKKLGVTRGPADLKADAEFREEVNQWLIRNRLVSGFDLNTSHAYGEIVRRNSEHFVAHPEDIVPRESGVTRKLDPARPTLLDVAARDALTQFTEDPLLDSVSVEPSDGGGWRVDSPLGRPTHQALTLANHVARAVRKQCPGRKVGMLAYNEHSPPPDFDVDPDVIISIATMFLRGGVTIDQAIDGWRARGADIGIREYLSLYGSSRDLPGRARSEDWNYLLATIPRFHEKGARYWKAEASRTWFPHGLGYYLASRLLWNTGEAAHAESLADEFYRRSFGAAADDIRQLHERYLLAQGKPLMSEDLVGRMYRLLNTAMERADSAEAKDRIADYVGYARYLELTLAVDKSGRSSGDDAARQLTQFEFRFRNTPIVNAGGYYRHLSRAGRIADIQSDWTTERLSRDEATAILRRGIETNRITSFEPIAFSDELVPLPSAGKAPTGTDHVTLVQTTRLLLYADRSASFAFEVTGNQIYANRGPVRLKLFAVANPLVDQATAELEVPADKQPHAVELKAAFAGLHRLEISDGGAGTRLSWPAGQPTVLSIGAADAARVPSNYKYDGVFYVPRGTKVVGGYTASAAGKILLPDGREAIDLRSLPPNSYFSFPVPPNFDGCCWRLAAARRGVLLLTVPPNLARSPDELLVPSETLTDGGKVKRPGD
jgi:hypothetical protein